MYMSVLYIYISVLYEYIVRVSVLYVYKCI